MNKRSLILSFGVLLVSSTLFAGCQSKAEEKAIVWPCLNPPSMTASMPKDTTLSDQTSFNCFAWQEFISVNWPSKPGEAFGLPGSYTPVIFETYMSTQEFLKPDGSQPPKWEERSFEKYDKDMDIRTMHATSKITVDFDPSQDLEQAFPAKSDRAWLADKEGNLVWYEILVNKDEFDYIYKNKFYNSMEQYKAAESGTHIDLPLGDLDTQVGAMEFKAAWLSVADENDAKWNRYKMTKAKVCSYDGVCKAQPFALVGLHIIHKTTSQASWVWATFEHMDNAPDKKEVTKGTVSGDYNFYSDRCEQSVIAPECINGAVNQKTSCQVNTAPAYALNFVDGQASGKCQPYPIQVAREFPIPATNENPVQQTNTAAHQLIKEASPSSVYQYYNLVNVLWNDASVNENKAKELPLNSLAKTGFRPNSNTHPVANTVLETYIQGMTCISCHSAATLSPPKHGKRFASDYSFVFGLAGPKKE